MCYNSDKNTPARLCITLKSTDDPLQKTHACGVRYVMILLYV